MLSNIKLIKTLRIIINVVFYGYLFFMVVINTLNYIDPIDKTLTFRGNVNLLEQDWKPMSVKSLNDAAKPIFLMYKSGFLRLDYDHWLDALSINAMAYFVVYTLWLLMGLFIVYQLRKIFNSLADDKVFKMENLIRIRMIGTTLLLMPFAKFGSDLLFRSMAAEQIAIEGHLIVAKGFAYQVPFLLLAILVFVLVEIFSVGLALQHENDLTI